MNKFLNPKQNKGIKSRTIFTQTEDQQPTVLTELQETQDISTVVSSSQQWPLCRALRGSITFFCRPDGKISVRATPYNEGTVRPVHEAAFKTTHGELYQNARKTRIVFEWPLGTDFEDIADQLDDEIYDLREWLIGFGSPVTPTGSAAPVKVPEASPLPTGLTGVKSVGGPKRKKGGRS